ncbi:unnamed protein product [Xylocopa violacea]|uniref:Leucine-rich PPR motif-containing protein, mitochondrial n=1 Tax=Xylocopa violacea TaxID=135666 RepID=A0ABP1P6H6_XYLVO
MILIRRYNTLFKTTITYNSMVFITTLHKSYVAHCYCTLKTLIINLRIKNIRNLSDNNNTSSIKDFQNKLMILSESFNNKRIKLDVLKSVIDDLESNDYNISETLSVMLLSCCGNVLYDEPLTTRLELIDRILNFLKRKEYPLTINHYHALLKAYIDNDHAIDPDKFLKSMTVTPAYETYCLLLQVPSTTNYAFADTVISNLEQNILPIRKTICDALAYMYAINGNVDGITKTLELMKKENLTKTSEIKTYLMYSYAKNGQIMPLTHSLENTTLSLKHIAKIVKYLSLSGNGLYIPNILKHVQPLTTEKDIIPTIIQLVHAGCILDAHTIVVNVPVDKECKDIRRILALCFLKLIIKLNIDQNIMLQVVNNLMKVELNLDILHETINFILEENNVELAFQLLYQMKTIGVTLQTYNFWPIISYVQNQTHGPDIYTVMKHMMELNVKPDFTTLIDHVLPCIDLSKPIVQIIKMNKIGVAPSYTVEPVVKFLLDRDRLKESAAVCSWFNKKIDCQPILDSLYSNYRKSNDINTCTKLLYQLTYNGRGFAALFINKMIKDTNFKTTDAQSLISFLTESKRREVVISTIDAKNISNIILTMTFNQDDKTSILDLISDITVDSFEKNYNTGQFVHPEFMNINQLSEHYELLKTDHKNTRGALRKLFIAACHQNNVKLVQDLIVQVNKNNFKWTPGMKFNLFDFYVKNGMIEEAWSELHEIQSQFQNMKIDNFKILRFVILLITENNVNDALNVIEKCTSVNHKSDAHTQIYKILCLLMQNDHLEHVERMVDLLIERGYSNKFQAYRYLILAQILKGNIEKAVTLFRDCVNNFNKTPAKQEILVELMKLPSDSSSRYDYLLQEVYSLIIDVHNEDIANINLAIAYALCNKTLELQHLLKANSIKGHLMLEQFKYLKESDIITVTLAILEAIETSPMVDLDSMCNAALAACDELHDCKHAMELQKKMISKNIKPTSSSVSCSIISFPTSDVILSTTIL